MTDLDVKPVDEVTDGFNLVVDALRLNGVDTIYGLVGIPITDLARTAQAKGIRYIGFRNEQAAGHAAAAAGFLTQRAGICLTVSAPGFLNGLRRRPTGSSGRRTSASAWHEPFVPRSPGDPEGSTWTYRPAS